MSGLQKLKSHILVCTHKDCLKQGSKDSIKELKHALKERDLRENVLITKVDCLDQCGRGPVMVVYPEGVWYGGVDEKGARAIVEQHLEQGIVAEGVKVLHEMREERKAK